MKGAFESGQPPEWELFDVEKDPHEMHNLYGNPKYTKITEQLKKELARVQAEADDKPV